MDATKPAGWSNPPADLPPAADPKPTETQALIRDFTGAMRQRMDIMDELAVRTPPGQTPDEFAAAGAMAMTLGLILGPAMQDAITEFAMGLAERITALEAERKKRPTT